MLLANNLPEFLADLSKTQQGHNICAMVEWVGQIEHNGTKRREICLITAILGKIEELT